MSKQYFIVWNEAKSEGFITDDFGDAIQCQTGEFNNGHSAVAYDFYQSYEDDELILEKVQL